MIGADGRVTLTVLPPVVAFSSELNNNQSQAMKWHFCLCCPSLEGLQKISFLNFLNQVDQVEFDTSVG